MAAQGCQMNGCGIPFMLGQAVLRIYPVPFIHHAVAFDFGDDGRRGNGHGKRIAVNQRFLLDEHIQLHCIQQKIIWRNSKLPERLGHGLAARLINIPRVNPARIDLCEGPGQRVLAYAWS